jgi:hypothetical protein
MDRFHHLKNIFFFFFFCFPEKKKESEERPDQGFLPWSLQLLGLLLSLPLAPTGCCSILSPHPFSSEMTSPDNYGFRAFLSITYAQ